MQKKRTGLGKNKGYLCLVCERSSRDVTDSHKHMYTHIDGDLMSRIDELARIYTVHNGYNYVCLICDHSKEKSNTAIRRHVFVCHLKPPKTYKL